MSSAQVLETQICIVSEETEQNYHTANVSTEGNERTLGHSTRPFHYYVREVYVATKILCLFSFPPKPITLLPPHPHFCLPLLCSYFPVILPFCFHFFLSLFLILCSPYESAVGNTGAETQCDPVFPLRRMDVPEHCFHNPGT